LEFLVDSITTHRLVLPTPSLVSTSR
jgi:hypothetical protein